MNEHEPFLREIAATPDDDLPRLIYADWLEERGDPRGEFIRVQCGLARGSPEDEFELAQREVELLRQHEPEWLGPLAEYRGQWVFRRGFLDGVEIRVDDFLRHGGWLIAHHGLRSAAFGKSAGTLARLAECPHLARLHTLILAEQPLSTAALSALVQSPHFPQLFRLDVIAAGLGNAEVRLIAESPRLARLLMLDLGRNEIRNDGLAAIAHSPQLSELTDLELSENEIRLLGAQALAGSPYLTRLHYVGLRGNPIPRRGVDLIRGRFGKKSCVI